jgi:hypothetical protein
MKRIFLCSAVALSALLASCGKDDPEPVTGYDSKITFSSLQLYNGQYIDTVVARISISFTDQNDSLIKGIYQDSYVIGPVSDQVVHFNTPANPAKVNISLKIDTYGGTVDSVDVANLSYVRDGSTLVSQPMDFGSSNIQSASYTF